MKPEDILAKIDQIVKDMKGVHEYAYEHTLIENAEWMISTFRNAALELKKTYIELDECKLENEVLRLDLKNRQTKLREAMEKIDLLKTCVRGIL